MVDVKLFNGDCLEIMRTMPDKSVDAIITDPPYFRVKDEPWDHQWDTRDGFLAWMGDLCEQWQRILKPNGSLYVFASPQMAWHVEGVIRQRFNVLSAIRWNKPAFSTKAEMFDKETMRAPFPASENIIFAEQEASSAFLRVARLAAGLSSNDAGVLFPSANGLPTGAVRNWELGLNCPTEEQYNALASLYPLPPYVEAIRPFNATPDAPYTDVWTFATVGAYTGKHPCEKPLALIQHMIRLSSRPGAVVLDCFAGSGVTGEACAKLGRNFIGIEASRLWHSKATRRVAAANGDWQTAQAAFVVEDVSRDALPLFGLEGEASPA